jgi:selenocysteine lyase/cysteine desulfurase
MAAPDCGVFFPAELLNEIRSKFHHVESDPYSGPRIFFESASGSFRLKSMVEAVARENVFLDQLGRANPGSRHANELVVQGVQDVRDFLGAQSGTIMPATSSTHAVFRAVHAGLAAAPQGNVVTTDLEHPSIYDSTSVFARQYGHAWRSAPLNSETGFVEPQAILELVDERTRLVGLIHGSNMTGACLDIKGITAGVRRINADVMVVVDGVQYAPHAPVDVEDLDVDAYVFGPYKAFCVKGVGFAYLSERMAGLPHWALAGKGPDDWNLGSIDHAMYAAWSAVVDYLVWLGSHFTNSADRRQCIVAGQSASDDHMRALLHRCLYGSAKQRGLLAMDHVTVHAMTEDLSQRYCLFMFDLAGMDSYQGVELYNRAGLRLHNRVRDAYSRHTLEAMGLEAGIRLSANHANSPAEVDAFLAATEEIGRMAPDEVAKVTAGDRGPGVGEG